MEIGRGFYYNSKAANQAVNFIEKICKHTKGPKAGEAFILEEWQKEIVQSIFGIKNKKTNLRKYKTVYIFLPRKNGKSTLASAVALYMLFIDPDKGKEVYSCAGDKYQAKIIFSQAAEMCKESPILKDNCEIYRESIVNGNNYYRALSAESSTKMGYNASAIFFDELHIQKNRNLYETMTSSTGARQQPLTFLITTAGYDKHSICYEVHKYAEQVKSGRIKDPSFLPILYAADKDDDWKSPETWRKANPNLGVSIQEQYLKEQIKKAEVNPAQENMYRRLFLNQWTTQESKWLSDDVWLACEETINIEDLEGEECWGGLDLAAVSDTSCLTLIFPNTIEGKMIVLPIVFLPEDTALNYLRRENIPYMTWAEEGEIHLTEGNVADYNFIEKKILEAAEKYKLHNISFDRWNSNQLVNNLMDQGLELSPFGQGWASMSTPTKELERYILQKNIIHNNNQLLRWQLSNVQIKADPAGNIKVAKDKSSGKVDAIVATVMAIGGWIIDMQGDRKEGASIYDDRGIIRL